MAKERIITEAGPVRVTTIVDGTLRDNTRQELSPGTEPGTFNIDTSITDQFAKGRIFTEAIGFARLAQVTITGGIMAMAAGQEPGSIHAMASLEGMASYYAFEDSRVRIKEVNISGAVFARASIDRGNAQISVGPVTARIGNP